MMCSEKCAIFSKYDKDKINSVVRKNTIFVTKTWILSPNIGLKLTNLDKNQHFSEPIYLQGASAVLTFLTSKNFIPQKWLKRTFCVIFGEGVNTANAPCIA